MSRTIWTKFYWQDWLADAGLRRCSLAARGLWIDLLCIAAQHDPIGYVAIGGKGLSATDIARMAGASESEVSTLLDELAENGVFSRDRTGRIYSRRMLRDAKKAKLSQTHGKEGGNPDIRRGTVPKSQRVRPYKRTDSPEKTLRIFNKDGGKCHWCSVRLKWDGPLAPNTFHVDHVIAVCDGGTNDEENLVSACAQCNHARARKDWRNPSDTNPDKNSDTKPYKLEAISEEEKNRELRSLERLPKDDGWPEGFFRIWYAAFPRHKDPHKAEARLNAIRKAGKISWPVLMAATERYAAECQGKDPQYVKHPTTWLNAGSWANEPDRDYRPNGSGTDYPRSGADSIVAAGRRAALRHADAARRAAERNFDFDEASPANDVRCRQLGSDLDREEFGSRKQDLDLSPGLFSSPSHFS